MKKRKIIIYSITAAVLLFLVWFFFLKKEKQEVHFTLAGPTVGHIAETVTSTGTVQIVDTVTVGTQVSGIIKSIHVDFNDKVKKGQLLAEIDPTLLQATYDQIKGSLAQSQASLTYQAANYNRQKQLYEVGAISKSDYDNATSTFNAAKANVASITAQLRSANQNLAYTKIYSPLDGVVLSRNVSVGQTVASSFSTPTLFVLAKDITKMLVNASVDEADISHVSVGQKATFTVDAYLNNVFNGTVGTIRIDPTVSSNVVTYPTLINVDNSSEKLMPGMTATITIFSKEADSALLIPVKATKFTLMADPGRDYKVEPLKEAVEKGGHEKTVWVLNGNVLQQKKITTGLNDNTHVQVLSGLNKTDSVVTDMNGGKAQATTQGQSASPFMPKFPSRKK
ncbi:efflux RND transporter periplasmic adaptor subunit [Taibaiella soli]|uniref:Efflux RND transporter periplasmic adaptor subunit n=1 Tax=Taibaiella soli TaxID=1649169 RepID=A0A2W2B2R6_9BACT|nr:efflux RND transporter periplasmic adaptor subunit [Taibaiella soli]PZF74574.1 efflux RND transporter periplasmic adaptor subunit [Taibaiella soli]